MTDKGKERIQRTCYHLAMLRVQNLNTQNWTDLWQCADCDYTIERISQDSLSADKSAWLSHHVHVNPNPDCHLCKGRVA